MFEVLYDVMNERNGTGMTWRPLESFGGGGLETTHLALSTDGWVPGISDAGAHLAIFQVHLAPADAPSRCQHRQQTRIRFPTHFATELRGSPATTCSKLISDLSPPAVRTRPLSPYRMVLRQRSS